MNSGMFWQTSLIFLRYSSGSRSLLSWILYNWFSLSVGVIFLFTLKAEKVLGFLRSELCNIHSCLHYPLPSWLQSSQHSLLCRFCCNPNKLATIDIFINVQIITAVTLRHDYKCFYYYSVLVFALASTSTSYNWKGVNRILTLE